MGVGQSLSHSCGPLTVLPQKVRFQANDMIIWSNAYRDRMKCPNCETSFHPQMNIIPAGSKRNGNTIYLYFQICPECEEAIVGFKEVTPFSYALSTQTEDLILLHK